MPHIPYSILNIQFPSCHNPHPTPKTYSIIHPPYIIYSLLLYSFPSPHIPNTSNRWPIPIFNIPFSTLQTSNSYPIFSVQYSIVYIISQALCKILIAILSIHPQYPILQAFYLMPHIPYPSLNTQYPLPPPISNTVTQCPITHA